MGGALGSGVVSGYRVRFRCAGVTVLSGIGHGTWLVLCLLGSARLGCVGSGRPVCPVMLCIRDCVFSFCLGLALALVLSLAAKYSSGLVGLSSGVLCHWCESCCGVCLGTILKSVYKSVLALLADAARCLN